MRDRLKRRKGKSEAAQTEAPPAPLQPDFYGAPASVQPETPSAASAPSEPLHVSELVSDEPSNGPSEAEIDEPAQSAGSNGDAGRRRRRRGRGGRGRTSAARSVPTGDSAQPQPASPLPVGSTPQVELPVVQTAAPRTKGAVVLAIGLPGSGKSAWFKRHQINPLSSDVVRALLFDDPTEQRFQDLVFSNLRSMLKARLIARRPTNYVDATNLTPHDRQGWIKLAKDYGYEVQAVFFDVPVEVCLERNARRARVVPEDAMRRMAGKLKAPTFDEGFAKITVVRVKQKE